MSRLYRGEAGMHVQQMYGIGATEYSRATPTEPDTDARAIVKRDVAKLFDVDPKAVLEDGEYHVTIRVASAPTASEAWRAAAEKLSSIRVRSRTSGL